MTPRALRARGVMHWVVLDSRSYCLGQEARPNATKSMPTATPVAVGINQTLGPGPWALSPRFYSLTHTAVAD